MKVVWPTVLLGVILFRSSLGEITQDELMGRLVHIEVRYFKQLVTCKKLILTRAFLRIKKMDHFLLMQECAIMQFGKMTDSLQLFFRK